MKSIKTLLFALLIILAGNVAAQKEYVIKAAGMNIINVTNVAEVYLTENIALGNFTGVDFSKTGFVELMEEAQEVQESLGYEVYVVEFPYISTGADEGLDVNY